MERDVQALTRGAARFAASLVAIALLAPAGGASASADTATAAVAAKRAKGLTKGQRLRTDKLISQFENSTSKIQYCYIEALGDGRGYTAGRAGFTSATGDLLEVAERYTRAVGDNALRPLRPLLPRLRELAAAEDGSTEGLEELPGAWRETCRDPRQRRKQDGLVNEWYYRPAARRWRKLGLRRALSLAAIYDAEIQHGGGDDPDGVPAMLRRATKRAGGRPKRVGEKRWLRAFIRVRRATLAHAHDPDTREEWAESVDRADAWMYLLKTGQWRLRSPVRIRTKSYHLTIR